jgi:hypothetical protein
LAVFVNAAGVAAAAALVFEAFLAFFTDFTDAIFFSALTVDDTAAGPPVGGVFSAANIMVEANAITINDASIFFMLVLLFLFIRI